MPTLPFAVLSAPCFYTHPPLVMPTLPFAVLSFFYTPSPFVIPALPFVVLSAPCFYTPPPLVMPALPFVVLTPPPACHIRTRSEYLYRSNEKHIRGMRLNSTRHAASPVEILGSSPNITSLRLTVACIFMMAELRVSFYFLCGPDYAIYFYILHA